MSAVLRPTATVAAATFPTRLFGQISVPSDAVVHFPDGIPGFPLARKFALLPAAAARFSWLQSLDEPALAFLLVEFAALGSDFTAEGDAVFAIVTLPAGDRPATANLQAPICIDRAGVNGRQLIRTDDTPGTAVSIDLESLIQPA